MKIHHIKAVTHCSSSKLPHMNFQENLSNRSRDTAKKVHCSLSTVIVTITACRECVCVCVECQMCIYKKVTRVESKIQMWTLKHFKCP